MLLVRAKSEEQESMKIKRRNVFIPLYYGKLQIVVAKDLRKAMNKVGEPIPQDWIPENYDGFVTWGTKDNHHYYTVFILPTVSHSTVAHEALHITNRILQDINHTPTFLADEPQAYLLGWVVKQIHLVLNKKK